MSSDQKIAWYENQHGGLGRAAYMAYREDSQGKSLVSGAEIPLWQDLDPRIQQAWNAAAHQVRAIVLEAIVEIANQIQD